MKIRILDTPNSYSQGGKLLDKNSLIANLYLFLEGGQLPKPFSYFPIPDVRYNKGGHLAAYGLNMSPDYDPEHIHYHTKDGLKIEITLEDWNKHYGQPYFKEIQDAVEAELKAFPNPEYIINLDFVNDLVESYPRRMSNYLNYKLVGTLPDGYFYLDNGMIQDSNGNLFVLDGFKQSPRFTYDSSKPLQVPVFLNNANEGNVTYYPVNMEKTIKPALPISRIMNVPLERESAIQNYNPRIYKSPMGFMNMNGFANPNVSWFMLDNGDIGGWILDYENNTQLISEDEIRQANPYLNSLITADEYNSIARKINSLMKKEESNDISGSKYHYIPFVKPNYKEAEKKAVIEVDPLQILNEETPNYSKGGHLKQGRTDSNIKSVPLSEYWLNVNDIIFKNRLTLLSSNQRPTTLWTPRTNDNIIILLDNTYILPNNNLLTKLAYESSPLGQWRTNIEKYGTIRLATDVPVRLEESSNDPNVLNRLNKWIVSPREARRTRRNNRYWGMNNWWNQHSTGELGFADPTNWNLLTYLPKVSNDIAHYLNNNDYAGAALTAGLTVLPFTKTPLRFTNANLLAKYNPNLSNSVIKELLELDRAGAVVKRNGIDPIFLLGLLTEAGKTWAPKGVSIYYRGVDPTYMSLSDFRTLNGSNYYTKYLGNKKMALGYVNGFENSMPTKTFTEYLDNAKLVGQNKSNLYQLAVPKGNIMDLGNMGGSHWLNLYRTSNNKRYSKILNEMDLLRKLRGFKPAPLVGTKEYDEYRSYLYKLLDLLNEADLLLKSSPTIKDRFGNINTIHSIDEIDNMFRNNIMPENVHGVLVRNVDDGPVGNELLYNVKNPNAPFPKSTIASDLTFSNERDIWKANGGSLSSSTKSKLFEYLEPLAIKDNRGLWDYPGYITLIDSNNITMDNVPYDVLGISDTGDTKLMHSGNNYKYKGNLVMEIPLSSNYLFQEGGNINSGVLKWSNDLLDYVYTLPETNIMGNNLTIPKRNSREWDRAVNQFASDINNGYIRLLDIPNESLRNAVRAKPIINTWRQHMNNNGLIAAKGLAATLAAAGIGTAANPVMVADALGNLGLSRIGLAIYKGLNTISPGTKEWMALNKALKVATLGLDVALTGSTVNEAINNPNVGTVTTAALSTLPYLNYPLLKGAQSITNGYNRLYKNYIGPWRFSRELNNNIKNYNNLSELDNLYTPIISNYTLGSTPIKSSYILYQRPNNLTEAERLGIPRGERNNILTLTDNPLFTNMSLINRGDNPININNKGLFVFESPLLAKKLSTLHFTTLEPVVSHGYGNWGGASTTLLLPYKNVRGNARPLSMQPMDTFFPNYNGLNISSRNSKVLTGNNDIYLYYLNHGIDATFSLESKNIIELINNINNLIETLGNKQYRLGTNEFKKATELYDLIRQLEEQNDIIHRQWAIENSKKPTLQEYKDLINAEYNDGNLASPEIYPIRDIEGLSFYTDLQKNLGYWWYNAPTDHLGLIDRRILDIDRAKDNGTYSLWLPETERFIRFMNENKADYRAKGGHIYIKPENRGKFTALKERTGHSASWFKENGTPAQKKMAVFALNSRHWKH